MSHCHTRCQPRPCPSHWGTRVTTHALCRRRALHSAVVALTMSSARFEVGLLCASPSTATGQRGLSSAAAQVTRRLYVFVQHGELDAPPGASPNKPQRPSRVCWSLCLECCGAESNSANAADAAALQMLALMYDAIATEVCGDLSHALDMVC